MTPASPLMNLDAGLTPLVGEGLDTRALCMCFACYAYERIC
jgi:hypothetical protein